MKAIILAAGIGRRLLPLTENKPKALLEVGGKSLSYYQLESLQKNMDLKDVYIVTGHCSKLIENVASSCRIIKNQRYANTNNIYSLWLMKDIVKEEFILLNSDVLFHEKILNKIINSDFENAIIVDDYKDLGEEEMKVILNNEKMVEISKDINPKKATGEYIGIAYFSKNSAKILFDKIDVLVKRGKVNEWYEKAFAEVVNDIDIYGVSTNGLPWIEIDDFTDLKNAQMVIDSINNEFRMR
jgi:choline kinase